MEFLSIWWTQKYNLPSNHELFQERTVLDLMTEYYVDLYREKPLEAHRNEDGEIQLKDTGDDLIDRWEEVIAQGGEPDLWEAFNEDARTKVSKKLGKSKKKLKDHSFGAVMEQVDRDLKRADTLKSTGQLSSNGTLTHTRRFNTFGSE